jgi:hypothetical protein
MIQPHELVYGAIFEYNLGDKDFPEWELRTLNLDNIRECIECNDFYSYRAIEITPHIFYNWFDKSQLTSDIPFTKCKYVHQLQMLIQSITNEPLKITLE